VRKYIGSTIIIVIRLSWCWGTKGVWPHDTYGFLRTSCFCKPETHDLL